MKSYLEPVVDFEFNSKSVKSNKRFHSKKKKNKKRKNKEIKIISE